MGKYFCITNLGDMSMNSVASLLPVWIILFNVEWSPGSCSTVKWHQKKITWRLSWLYMHNSFFAYPILRRLRSECRVGQPWCSPLGEMEGWVRGRGFEGLAQQCNAHQWPPLELSPPNRFFQEWNLKQQQKCLCFRNTWFNL